MSDLPGDPYLPPGTSNRHIDAGCLLPGQMHCNVCFDICDEHDSGLCQNCIEQRDEAEEEAAFKRQAPPARSNIRAGIFVASYARDFPFLKGLLKSIKKFCHGFNRVSVAVPRQDKPLLLKLLKSWGMPNGDNNLLVWEQHEDIRDGFMRAQHAMMNMNVHLWDCTHYVLVGSDCLFTADVTPEHYIPNGKPFMRIDSKRFLGKDSTAWHWLTGTEKATGFKPEYDYMRQLPLIYTPRMLEVTREQVRKHTGKTLHDYLSVKHNDFSESNVMGVCAHRLCPEECEWVVDKPLPMPMNLIQLWSHGGLDDHRLDRAMLYNNVRGKTKNTQGQTAREITIDVLGREFYDGTQA